MINMVKTVKISLVLFILWIQACSSDNSKKYLKDADIQNVLDKSIDSLLVAVPIPDYVSVLFRESGGKTYVFVTGLLSVNEFKTKYYFERGNKQVLVGFSPSNLEERFANINYKKPEIIFEHINRGADIFDGNSVIYEIRADNTIKRINPNDEIWELQFSNVEPLVEPPLK